MDRLACIDLPAFPLQLLLRRHPEWRRVPTAVVHEDRPLGRILWVNEQARRARILPGMRYAAALALAFDLCAGVVAPVEIERQIDELIERLHRFSPEVEPAGGDPGLVWLGARGFRRLHPSLGDWAREIVRSLAGIDLEARVAVGYTRFGTCALARGRDGAPVQVMRSPAEESAAARGVRLDRLRLDPGVRDLLAQLGVQTVGDFVDLPAGGIQQRFGVEVLRLHQQARGDLELPLAARPEAEPLAQRLELEVPETDRDRLLFMVTRLLHPLLAALAARGQVLAELAIELDIDDLGRAGDGDGSAARVERLRPAAPTLHARQLLDLVRLRLERMELAGGVEELRLDAVGVPATSEQLELFAERRRRDPAAAARACARLRAELGDDVVLHAVLTEGHLPEASFAWEPLLRVAPAAPGPVARRTLVRRIHRRPEPLAMHLRHELDRWLLASDGHTRADEVVGPYVISGGWWRREIQREYHFLRGRRSEWLWIYFDARRQRWYLQGRVE